MGVKDYVFHSISRCFDYHGRSSRLEFWSYNLLVFCIMFCCLTLLTCYSYVATSMIVSKMFLKYYYYLVIIVIVFSACVGLLISLCGLSLLVRRLHDINRSGLWLLVLSFSNIVAFLFFCHHDLINSLSYLLFYGVVWMGFLIFLSMPGDNMANDYGDCPK